ncbi:organic hydroperoxide resistance protein [Priestia koreensis]|uniref:organic hydroperoxide resistance protein n=1 Tax=Priestia koreensis TaxID=284581 RepID=UPI001F56C639|nr:organic hydroperoxide resistance protein [Priestia koreensis]UNL82873.1 organic hydroperoxide resistance protein [Priestia koreensis]
MKPMYTAKATTVGGRDGHVKSSDGVLDLNVATPKEMGGKGGDATNPEQLFAAGYSACFDSALNLVINKKRIKEVEGTEVTAEVSIGKDESDNGFKIAVELIVKVKGVPKDQAQELVEAAHQVCPYSKATRGNVQVNLTVAE